MSLIPEITVHALKGMMDAQDPFSLLDVRQPQEHMQANIGGKLIPLGELTARVQELGEPEGHPLVVYCRSGARSGRAVQFLHSQGLSHAVNLKGGMIAWAQEIDPSKAAF